MSKPQVFKIIFDGASGNAFSPGQLVSGQVLVETSERIQVRGIRLQVSGTGYASLNDQWGTLQYVGHESYISLEIPLMGSDDPNSEQYLEACTNTFPFSFQLPLNVPRSFECAFGYIRYKATALLDRLVTVDVSEVPLVIHRLLDLNQEPHHLREPLVIQSQNLENSCCCVRGIVDISAVLNRGCFVPGETVHLNGTIVNRTNATIIRLTLTLVQDLELCTSSTKNSSILATTHSVKTLMQITRPPIERGSQDVLSNVSFVVPLVPSSRLEGSKLFNITYHLKITTFFSSCSSSSICREIVIGDFGFPNDFQPHAVTHQPQGFQMSYFSAANSGYPQMKSVHPTVSGYNAYDASSSSQNFTQSIEVPPMGFAMNDFHSRSFQHSDLAGVHSPFFMMPDAMGWNQSCEERPEAHLPGYHTNAAICGNSEYFAMTGSPTSDFNSGQDSSMNYGGGGLSEATTIDFNSSEANIMSQDCIGTAGDSTVGTSACSFDS